MQTVMLCWWEIRLLKSGQEPDPVLWSLVESAPTSDYRAAHSLLYRPLCVWSACTKVGVGPGAAVPTGQMVVSCTKQLLLVLYHVLSTVSVRCLCVRRPTYFFPRNSCPWVEVPVTFRATQSRFRLILYLYIFVGFPSTSM
jgi:hypothetical protein